MQILKFFQLFLPDPFGDVLCASHVTSKIRLFVCRLHIKNILFILSGKRELRVMWHWILENETAAASSSSLEKGMELLDGQGKEFTIGSEQ